jgi:hypothetical protein
MSFSHTSTGRLGVECLPWLVIVRIPCQISRGKYDGKVQKFGEPMGMLEGGEGRCGYNEYRASSGGARFNASSVPVG